MGGKLISVDSSTLVVTDGAVNADKDGDEMLSIVSPLDHRHYVKPAVLFELEITSKPLFRGPSRQ